MEENISILNVFEHLKNKYDWEDSKIIYYFNISEVLYRYLKQNKLKSFKIENFIRAMNLLKKDGELEIIRDCFRIVFNVEIANFYDN